METRPLVSSTLMVLMLPTLFLGLLSAQQVDEDLEQDRVEKRQVVALLGSQAVTLAEVYFHLGRGGSSQAENLPDAARALPRLVRENTLRLIASQNQALQTLRSLKLSADADEIRAWIVANVQPLELSGSAESLTAGEIVKAIAERADIPERVFWDQVEFRLAWRKYLAKHVNSVNIARHFASQKARFDGTEFRIWMVSLPAPAGESTVRAQATQRLSDVATKINDVKDVTHVAQLASEGGFEFSDVMWVQGVGDLDSKVVDALLTTDAGSLTGLTHTAGGVHLIGLLEKNSGDRGLEEVTAEVRMHMLEFLLEHLAAQSRDKLPLKAVVTASEDS